MKQVLKKGYRPEYPCVDHIWVGKDLHQDLRLVQLELKYGGPVEVCINCRKVRVCNPLLHN